MTMFVAGLMTVHAFPLDESCFVDLLKRVEAIVLYLDLPAVKRRPRFEQLIAQHGQHIRVAKLIEAREPWSRYQVQVWQEPKLRALGDVRPDYVLQADGDETFGPGFEQDLIDFRASGRDMLMFEFAMPTADGAIVPIVSPMPHCKVFCWRPGLTFVPYLGYCRVTGLRTEMAAKSKIQHYCYWTRELQAADVADFEPAKKAHYGRRDYPHGRAG